MEQAERPLSPGHQAALEQFILLWGEMASDWGINRTMAQIHALLYASERPLDTDEIMDRLQISRGNANMNLRSLMSWNLIRKIHQIGSRKDYYVAEHDVWKIFATIVQERQRREIKPVRRSLEECLHMLVERNGTPAREEVQFAERIRGLTRLISAFEGFTEALLPFVREQNVEMIQQFIVFAAGAARGSGPDAPEEPPAP